MNRWDEVRFPEWRHRGGDEWMVMPLLQERDNCAELMIGHVKDADSADYSEENMEILKNLERLIMRVIGEFVLSATRSLTEVPSEWAAFERWCELRDQITQDIRRRGLRAISEGFDYVPPHLEAVVRECATIEVEIGGHVAGEWPRSWEPLHRQDDVDPHADTKGG